MDNKPTEDPPKEPKFPLFMLISLGVVLIFTLLYRNGSLVILDPSGWIASQEKDLMIITSALMLIVVVPVCILTVVIAWKYRSGNTKAKYTPDWHESTLAEVIWWGVPFVIITVLSILTWKGSHDLDPFKPLDSPKKPIEVQVVALQWKWLFIYPEYHIASVNELHIPENTPIHFCITADAPMNSFWIPKMGGQIYAMPGMKTELNLIADEIGIFRGSSANLSGTGFAGMVFSAISESEEDFQKWTQSSKENILDLDTYKALTKPSENNP
ncbi:MAG: ubiquinol oxidase subunit II, partial [Verrucomicrobia bacterium]|nr:ubiquinol oxidase subunit II [Verrucomicrobiota bacterium]